MSVRIEFDRESLRPVVEMAVTEALSRFEDERAKFNGRLAFTEPEAAALLGVKPHVLRDCRRRGQLHAAKVGAKIVYTRQDLIDFLESQKNFMWHAVDVYTFWYMMVATGARSMTLESQLKEAVQESGLSLYAISKQAAIPYPVLYRFVHGERDLKLATASRLAEFFGMRLTRPKRRNK